MITAGADGLPPGESSSPKAFVYVDTAVGGANRRNRVVRADGFAPPPDGVDCFRTFLLFTKDLLRYMETNRNAKGDPSVAGYPGPSLALAVPLDFDREDDPTAALADARAFVRRFCARYEVPPQAIQAWFSGRKGISLELPAPLFGGFDPSPETAARLKALVAALAEGLPTLDGQIYERVRLWRVENTVNGKSGLFKIPLTPHELLALGLDEIRRLAAGPRTVERVPDDEWEPVPDLVALWQGTAPRPRTPSVQGRVAARRLADGQVDELVAVVGQHWAQGQKHDLALCLAGYLARAGVDEEQALGIVGRLAGDDERPGDRANAVRDSYHRLRDGQATLGFVGLRRLLPEATIRELERLTDAAAVAVTVGGRRYARDADARPGRADRSKEERTGGGEPRSEPGADDPKQGAVVDRLRRRAEEAPAVFVREALEGGDAIGALACAARDDRAAHEGFLIRLREVGVKAADVKRLERAINDALRRGRPRFRAVRADEAVGPPRVKDALLDAPVGDDAVVPFGYRLDAGGVVREHLSDEGERRTVPIAPVPILVTGRLVDDGDGTELLRLAFPRDGAWRSLTAPRGTAMNARLLVALADRGLPVTSPSAAALAEYLGAYEAANLAAIPRARVSAHLGWQGERGERGFLWGRRLLGGDGADAGDGDVDLEAVAPEDWREDWTAFRGADAGDEQLVGAFRAAGTLEGWLAAVAPIAPYPRVRFGLYAALAAPLLEPLGVPSFGVDWAGVTSQGKTTVLRVAASAWGCPDPTAPASVVGTWNASRVHVERRAALLHGLPTILDDTKQAKTRDFVGQAVYDLMGGQGRGRGSPQGLRRSGAWRTVLLSTGEMPAVAHTQDGGTRARMLTLWGPPFGRADAGTAGVVNRLALGLGAHHGHAGPALVRRLLADRDNWGALRDAHRLRLDRYLERAGDDPVAGRIAAYLAAVDAAAALAHEVLPLPWAYADPVDPVWEAVTAEAGEADRAAAALALVQSWAKSNEFAFDGRHRTDGEGNPKLPPGGWLGAWEEGEGWGRIALMPHRLRGFLADEGFDVEAVLRTWQDRRWLDGGDGGKRSTRTLRVFGTPTRVYALRRAAFEALGG